jgi:hypothetical protein
LVGWHHQRPFFQFLLRQVSASGVQLFYSKGLDLYSTGSVTFQGFLPSVSSLFCLWLTFFFRSFFFRDGRRRGRRLQASSAGVMRPPAAHYPLQYHRFCSPHLALSAAAGISFLP